MRECDRDQFACRLQIKTPPFDRIDLGLADDDPLPARVKRSAERGYNFTLRGLLTGAGRLKFRYGVAGRFRDRSR